ncbi:FMN-dependent NADH-azoreductase [Glycocaulis abyssi]|uniref:FMN dependent NADH:quinone oxidoreductase n=1 Tax=Glycocaulis abyssi TaxID=1433403 RepID=A0ABV9NBH5_9PROT
MTLLHIDSSILGEASASRQIGADLVAALAGMNRDLDIAYRDLAAAPPAHLDGSVLQAVRGDVDGLNDAQRAERAYNDTLVDEFLAADIVVMGAPMYNFSVPTQLKAWLDRLAVPGKTFRYTETGPVGLAGGKTVYVVSSRGGKLAGSAAEAAMDHQEAYLKTMMGFFGITDVRIVRAEGLGMGEDARAEGLHAAASEIAKIIGRKAA